MIEETPIPRFNNPTLEDLKDLPCTDEVRETIRKVLCSEVDPREVSPAAAKWYECCYHKPRIKGHELKLCAVDDLLGMSGVESLEVEGDRTYEDCGIRMCPAFSYANTGDPYETTLLRDHVEGAWLVGCWGDILDEYEQANELGSYKPCDDCDELGEHECKGREEEEEEEEDPRACAECGEPFTINTEGIATHDGDTPDGIDHDADANHVPYN